MSEDLIKRSDAIAELWDMTTEDCPNPGAAVGKCMEAIRHLPSADRPQGYWINDNGAFRCSVCGEREDAFIDGWDWEVCGASKFCPNCGAQMKGADDE